MGKLGGILIILVLALSISGLFQIKFKVQYLSKDVSELKRQLEQEKESIHILKAEWAYLNHPTRLKELADNHLKLSEVKINQLYKFEESEVASTEKIKIAQAKPKEFKHVKWNYKDKNMFIYSATGKKLLISINGGR